MKRVVRWPMIAVSSMLAVLMPACRTRPQPVPLPLGPAVPEELIQGFVAEGDKWTRAMHLDVWRQAEKAYAAAHDLAPSPEIRDKLVLVKLLRMTREIDEDIACPRMEKDIEFICENPQMRARSFRDRAGGYAVGPFAAARS